MALITVNDVQIKGLTVEIKSLTVGKKQLTLSLMRQFIEEPIVDEEQMLLRGTPWGFINYFWGDDKDKKPVDFLHLIWQKGSELRRCVLAKQYRPYQKQQQYRSSQKAVEEWRMRIGSERKKIREIEDKLNKIAQSPETWSFYNKEGLLPEKYECENKIRGLEDDINDYTKEMDSISHFFKYLLPKYHDLILSMKDLPHFFIAV